MMAAPQPLEMPSSTWKTLRPTTQIQELVAVSYGIHPRYMVSKHKVRDVAWPRQVAMYLTRKLTHRSLPSIGAAFGGRDHTTVMYAVKAVERRMREDPLVHADVQAFKRALEK